MTKSTTNEMTHVRISADAYEAIDGMGFSLITVLQVFGEEVCQNNSELNDSFPAREVIDAFTHLMLEQARLRANPNRFEALFYK